jgi:hypothetical protein
MLSANERNVVRYIRAYGWSINRACLKWGVNHDRLRAKTEFQDALAAPRAIRAPRVDEELRAIEKPTPQARTAESAADRETRLAGALARMDAEAEEAARAREANPPDPANPQSIVINPPDPEYKRPSMWHTIQEHERAAEERRRTLGLRIFQERHYNEHGGRYMEESATMKAAREAAQAAGTCGRDY